ncbi:unnamed protein product [Rotaria magnacalcarata]|uniref:Uncharacterized protein n=1 Tax=Rotaria magnacalcarata TaxID=392030 RepID=A0A816QT00_9BILA|nr:unnamed protein product [Rotaria magnacalcarata]CAF1525613.1 unnamed protein product [Rotaria magnacalcarata]CAF2065939.1 unnamed protein product [Rotaria magnacalcarata]CAF2102690.1 unnamed protein product [Rotaria magnacalcarata]CAF2207716.1 unnamed protein product [Rotaria magnacalcarata]
MYLLNHVNDSLTFSPLHFITSSSIYRRLNINKPKQRRHQTTTISYILNITSLSYSTSQNQQASLDEPYSVKTGIKTAALLGGILACFILYLLWKARTRLCRAISSSESDIDGGARLSANKFDLDYWLKQVDLLEAREAERNRGGTLPYLELPTEEPRDSQLATASWISDAYRQWRLMHFRYQHRMLEQKTNQPTETNLIPYRRRRHILRRCFRRLLIPSHQTPSFLDEHLSSLIADLRPSIVNNNLIPPLDTLDIPPRRVASWPRLKSTQQQNGLLMTGAQTRYARKRLLLQRSRTDALDLCEKNY